LRRDEILSSGPVWQYDNTLSGFEEGFAQAVSYEAMTEFARRYPSFGLTQQIYQSSTEWDYDFQNVPELRTTDFWSDTGGMLLNWIRYEMAAAAIAKIEWEHPGFHRAFNAEYYRRLNADPHLTTSRDLIKQIIQTVAPSIEGKLASQWIDDQNIFDCSNHPGKKIWMLTQHYPASDYYIFNRVYFYETFSNGSDWAYPDGMGGYIYYHLNGSTGTFAMSTSAGDVIWQRNLLTTPVDNPPVYPGYGNDETSLTTAPDVSSLPQNPDPTKYFTNISSLDMYRLTVQFTSGTTTTHDYYDVIGAPLRNTSGVFGGVAGANGGSIYLHHRNHPPEPAVPLVNRAFWTATSWASLQHPATSSVDTDPGLVDVTYVDGAGTIYTDVRTIGYGSSSGTQTFLFDVSRMVQVAPEAPSITSQPSNRTVNVGQDVQFTVAANGEPPPSYQWQLSSDSGTSWTNVMNVAPYSGASTVTLLITGATLNLNGYRYRATAGNSAGVASSSAATLTVIALPPTITSHPQSQTIVSGHSAALTVVASGSPPLTYQWYVGTTGTTANPITAATFASYTTPPLTSMTSYWVRVSNPYGASSDSNTATIRIYLPFTDDVLTPLSSLIRLVHVTELRQRIDALRIRFGLSPFVWTDATPTIIRAQHIVDLRSALSEAFDRAFVSPMAYTDTVITPGITVKAVHITEIRENVITLELH
jgi:hypothetical protein